MRKINRLLRFSWFFFLAFSSVYGTSVQKKAYIITGPESSGSTFISEVIAYVVGKDSFYRQWAGYRMNGNIGDDLVVFHVSQPYRNPNQYCTLADFHEIFDGYDLYFIITTRDVNIVKKSKKKRFSRFELEAKKNEIISGQILSNILQKEKCFIWSYETQNYLKETYFQMLYKFLGVESDFFPKDFRDENKKYLVR